MIFFYARFEKRENNDANDAFVNMYYFAEENTSRIMREKGAFAFWTLSIIAFLHFWFLYSTGRTSWDESSLSVSVQLTKEAVTSGN
jgi:hypothetical protein